MMPRCTRISFRRSFSSALSSDRSTYGHRPLRSAKLFLRLRLLPPPGNPSQIFFSAGKMDVFFINPEPLFLVLNRPVADRAVPIHHAHCIGRVCSPRRNPLQAPTRPKPKPAHGTERATRKCCASVRMSAITEQPKEFLGRH